MRRLCATTLGFEAVVLLLAIVPTIALGHASGAVAGGLGAGLAVIAIVAAGVVGKPGKGWALIAGSVLQAAVIASGAFEPAMYVLGVIFAALWFGGILLARKWEAIDAERAAQAQAAESAQSAGSPQSAPSA
jgi:hypothetical protein